MFNNLTAKNEISVIDIYKEKKNEKQDKSKYYNVVLEKCYNKIRQAVKLNKWSISYEVPKFIVGLPIYRINYCCAYIMIQLKKNGFVIFINPKQPNLIHISWQPKDIATFKTLNNVNNINNHNAVEDNLHYCNDYDENLELSKYNTADFNQYLEFLKQKKQLTLPAPMSQNSRDFPVSNNLLNDTMVNDNLFTSSAQAQQKVQLQNPQQKTMDLHNTYARLNEPSNDILQYNFNQKNIQINKKIEPMNTILNDINNQSQDLSSFPINREVPVIAKHPLPIDDYHNIRLANKVKNEEYQHRQNLAEAKKMISVSNFENITKERAYEKEQDRIKKNHDNLMNMNNLLMNRGYIEKQKAKQKEYIKKHKDINSNGKNMFSL